MLSCCRLPRVSCYECMVYAHDICKYEHTAGESYKKFVFCRRNELTLPFNSITAAKISSSPTSHL